MSDSIENIENSYEDKEFGPWMYIKDPGFYDPPHEFDNCCARCFHLEYRNFVENWGTRWPTCTHLRLPIREIELIYWHVCNLFKRRDNDYTNPRYPDERFIDRYKLIEYPIIDALCSEDIGLIELVDIDYDPDMSNWGDPPDYWPDEWTRIMYPKKDGIIMSGIGYMRAVVDLEVSDDWSFSEEGSIERL
jgi:hypothetical protein